MDDYILKVLSGLKAREEGETAADLKSRQSLSGFIPERAADPKELQATASAAEQVDRRESILRTMLKNMEPLMIAPSTDGGGTAGRTEDSAAGGYVPNSLSRLSGVVFGEKSRQLTPEGLSMFYQRDARRFS